MTTTVSGSSFTEVEEAAKAACKTYFGDQGYQREVEVAAGATTQEGAVLLYVGTVTAWASP